MTNLFVRKLIDGNETCRNVVDKMKTHTNGLWQICTIKDTFSYQMKKDDTYVKSDLEIQLDSDILSLENLLRDNLICETESKLFNYKKQKIEEEVKVHKTESFVERILSERKKEKEKKAKEEKNLQIKQMHVNLIFKISDELSKRLVLPLNTQILTKKLHTMTLDLKDFSHMSLIDIGKRNLKRKLPEIVDIHYPKYFKIKRQ